VKKDEKKIQSSVVEEAATPNMRQFSSQEEAERFNMIENLQKPDMEKFRLFCKMIKLGKMLTAARTVK
jgi:hypothetical protein